MTAPNLDDLLDRASDAAERVRDAEVALDHARLAERDAARKAYVAGATAYRIAQVMGRSQTAVGKWVADLK
ncbi:MAG: hypothetical protein ACTMIK_12085 [Galactobacter sp.]